MSAPAGGPWRLQSGVTSRGFPVLFRCTECTAQSVLRHNRAAFWHFAPTIKELSKLFFCCQWAKTCRPNIVSIFYHDAR